MHRGTVRFALQALALLRLLGLGLGLLAAACGDDAAAPGSEGGLPNAAGDARPAADGGEPAPDLGPPGRCTADDQCPPSAAACALSYCDRVLGRCVITGPDLDFDGHADATCDPGPGGTRGDDCDDADPRRFGGNREVCDAADLDEDCDPRTFGERDADGDFSFDGTCCNVDEANGGERICGGDCDDGNANVRPEDIADGPVMNCDTFDNDCDGTADEGCACAAGDERPCGGGPVNASPAVCRAGVQRCGVTGWGECVGATGPGSELCDAGRLDEDCDGEQNEGCACDDGMERACGGGPVNGGTAICRAGTERCLGGTWGACIGAMGPLSEELCDGTGQDEDCDGELDEGCACTDGQELPCGGGPVNHDTSPSSVCQRGAQRCSGGAWGACVGAVSPGTELCRADGQDEDCDGEVNEGCACLDGMTRPCGGGAVNGGTSACRQGTETCTGGAWGTCVGAIGPTTEACDETRADEDCDGMRNEGCGIVQVAVSGDSASATESLGTTCVLRESGVVSCWGLWGPEFDPAANRYRPFDVEGLPAASAAIAAGGAGFCARLVDGRVACWRPGASAAVVVGVAGATQVSVGNAHYCALRTDGTVLCWGDNAFYQSGGTTSSSSVPPTLVAGLTDAVEIGAGGTFSCARRSTGVVSCWGPSSATPTDLSGITRAVELDVGASLLCVRRVEEPPTCLWGPGDTPVLVTVVSPETITDVVVGRGEMCAIHGAAAGRQVECRGPGHLGNGETDWMLIGPLDVPQLAGATQLALSDSHSCALFGPTTVRCWGVNSSGQLGTGAVGPTQYTPVDAIYVPD